MVTVTLPLSPMLASPPRMRASCWAGRGEVVQVLVECLKHEPVPEQPVDDPLGLRRQQGHVAIHDRPTVPEGLEEELVLDLEAVLEAHTFGSGDVQVAAVDVDFQHTIAHHAVGLQNPFDFGDRQWRSGGRGCCCRGGRTRGPRQRSHEARGERGGTTGREDAAATDWNVGCLSHASLP
jgi:hypothetical protein